MKVSAHAAMNDDCRKCLLAVQDVIEALDGRWKLSILSLLKQQTRRFNELSRFLAGITPKALSKELKELEENQLIKRTVHNIFPPHVEYSITDHGSSLENVFVILRTWGDSHRQKIVGSRE